MTSCSKTLSLVALLVVMTAAMVVAQQTANCAAKLVPCSDSISSPTPSKECCDSLDDAITNDLKCLCDLFYSGVLNSSGINVTAALLLPQKCKLKGDLTSCANSNGASPTSTPSAPVPPPPPPGKNSAGRESWTGILSAMLLMYASVMIF